MKKMIVILIILLIPGLYSCETLGISTAKEAISIFKDLTTSADEAKDKKPIDSIVVKSEPVYWKEIRPCKDTIGFKEQEKEFTKNGYRIWYLVTPGLVRYEVQKKDSIIYLYKK